ncbi:transcription initiation factor TFIIE subunit beta [Nematocida displodere]|uniref:Transcription initiation factor TFIIE subunit beta n=1 Tax=Nematocida displodere TaxID=1805483 RepID=A0A177EFL6_9MICR|nr:transcription initiation factor TFIIE subunit beta [Nematocida displodere]
MDKSVYGKLSAGSPQFRHSNIYIHTILMVLKKHRRPLTFKEIELETGISIERTHGLLELLEKNPKIVRKDAMLEFVPTFIIDTEDKLLSILKETDAEHGIHLEEILDTNSDTKPFIEALVEKGQAILLKDIDGSSTLFYNPLVIARASPAVAKLYEEVAVPEPRELARELSSAGLATKVVEKPIRKATASQRKKKYIRKIKITNTHLNKSELGM